MLPLLALNPSSFQLLAPFVFAGSVPFYEVIVSGPPDQWRVTGDPAAGSRPEAQTTTADTTPFTPHFSFRLELKSIQVSLCFKSHSEADDHLCPKG